MDDARKRDDEPMPLTAEVGGEGGSYADPTYQEATLSGGTLRRASDTGQPNAAADVAGNAEHRDEIANGGVGTDPGPAEGMKKYPTEE